MSMTPPRVQLPGRDGEQLLSGPSMLCGGSWQRAVCADVTILHTCRISGTDQEDSAVVARAGRFRARTWVRAGAVLTVITAGLSGYAMTGAAKAQPTPITHIVVLYLENHTFDNMLGFWCDQNPTRCPDGGMPSSVRLSDGTVVNPAVTPDFVPKIAHSVAAEQQAIDGGKMDGWQNVAGCDATTGYACVGGYIPAQVPNLAALADRFAISDRTFSMADSPSWGGHLYAAMGQLDGFLGNNPKPDTGVAAGPGWGCDSNKITQWTGRGGAVQWVPSCIPDYSLGLQNGGAFEPTPASYAPTILDRLDSAGLSWRIYGEPKAETSGKSSPGYIWDICPSFAECLDTGQKANNVASESFA